MGRIFSYTSKEGLRAVPRPVTDRWNKLPPNYNLALLRRPWLYIGQHVAHERSTPRTSHGATA
jgi:hypothetical protein